MSKKAKYIRAEDRFKQEKINTIEYEEAPSGRINVGKWQPPFKSVVGGHGYHGVLAEDAESGKLQCHICGEWMELLCGAHLNRVHDMSSSEYREMFGLFKTTALKSKRIRLIQSKTMLGMRKKHKKHRRKFEKGNKEAANMKGAKHPLERENRAGVCDLQVAHKILLLEKDLGRTPSLTELIEVYGRALSSKIHKKYKSYITLCKSIGLTPVTSSFNPKYSREYFIEQIKERVGRVDDSSKIRIKSIFNDNEQRSIYRYFSSWEELKEAVNK